jgi:hypothetical protein
LKQNTGTNAKKAFTSFTHFTEDYSKPSYCFAMAKGKMNLKAAEKKRDRIAMMRKMDARVAIVKIANDQPDPMAILPSFKVMSNACNVVLLCSNWRV